MGGKLTFGNDGAIYVEDFGFPRGGEPFENFSKTVLGYTDANKIMGNRDYMALKKDGNVYLIIDTEEIPILNAEDIDEAYGLIREEKDKLSLFKRKKGLNNHRYLRGYIGLHLWKSEGFDREPNAAYSYIAGINSESLKITSYDKMTRVPRARRIFILHAEHKERVESDVREIMGMLRLGLGRWNEIMTYPYPFKFIKEHLDGCSMTTREEHWGWN